MKCCYNVCEGLDIGCIKKECILPNPACTGCAQFNTTCKGTKKADFYYPEDCDGFTRKHKKDWHQDGSLRSPYKHKERKQPEKPKPKEEINKLEETN